MKGKRHSTYIFSGIVVMALASCGVEEQDNPVEPPGLPEESPTELIPVDESFPDPTARAAELQRDYRASGLPAEQDNQDTVAGFLEPVPRAQAILSPTAGNKATGVVDFYATGNADGERILHIEATLSEVAAGEHGFHVHEVGDCSATDASSAGDHFNPDEMPHGDLDDLNSHAGDLGNITANEHGVATLDISTDKLQLNGENSLLNRAIVLHSSEDDLESQPSGDAGERIACGVVTRFEEVD